MEKKQGKAKKAVQQKQPVGAAKPKRKKQSFISFGAILSIIIILAVIGFFLAVYFDVGGLKKTAVSMLNLSAPTNAQLDVVNQQIAAAREELQSVKDETKDLKAKEEDLEKKEKQLAAREQALDTREQQIEDSKQQQKDAEETIKAASVIFEQMEAEKAAKAISELETTKEMAQLLTHMESDKAAAIMNEMDTDLASEIASVMMSQ